MFILKRSIKLFDVLLFQSKSLGEDTSILFSTPSSIMKDSLGVSALMDYPPQSAGSTKVHGWFHFGDNNFLS